MVTSSLALAIISRASGGSAMASGGNAAQARVCEREIERAARRHGVPEAILYAVGLAETARGGRLQPYALNIEGRTDIAADRAGAIRIIRAAQAAGYRLIDVGCMQINLFYHAREFADLDAVLAPNHNVNYAAKFLSRLKRRHGSWSMAVARYHAGEKNSVAQRKYVCRVLAHMVKTGFARHTPKTKKVCGIEG